MLTPDRRLLVFSDLDGSLLDHHTYSFSAALPALERLASLHIPLVLASSKTRREMATIRESLGNEHPYIVENGAAVIIPKAVSPAAPEGAQDGGDVWLYETVESRGHWLGLLAELEDEFGDQFVSFHAAGIEGIADMTGLSQSAAAAANDRHYSEPVEWQGSDTDKARFLHRLTQSGAQVQQGGRFLSISGQCDKGRALCWLRSHYSTVWKVERIEDLAIGDSANDLPMLEQARTALLIKSPAHDFPQLARTGGVMKSQSIGPAGWNEGVKQWLDALNV